MTTAIIDQDAINVILQYFISIDLNDKSLLESTLHPDFVYDPSDLKRATRFEMPVITGLRAASDELMHTVGHLDTAHYVMNFRAQSLKAGAGLEVKCYGISHHYRPGEAIMPDKQGLVAGNEYTSELVQAENGEWKLKRFSIRMMWCEGDMGVFGG